MCNTYASNCRVGLLGHIFFFYNSLRQRLGLGRSVRYKPRARSTSIKRRRCENPSEAEEQLNESFDRGATCFAKLNKVFEHTSLPQSVQNLSVKQTIIIELNKNRDVFISSNKLYFEQCICQILVSYAYFCNL